MEHGSPEAEWARGAALRLMRAAGVSRADLLAEMQLVLADIETARTKKRRGERLASLILLLAGIAGDAAGQFAKAKGGTFEEYIDELEKELAKFGDESGSAEAERL